MKLYHYTSIKSLAAILDSHKFRFTRLDLVDDPEEYCYTQDGIQQDKYTFVSCFTNNQSENLPQWQMYGDNKHGVRIGIDSSMFNICEDKGMKTIGYPLNYFVDKEYIFAPLLNNNILHKVAYVNDVKKETEKHVYKDLPQVKLLTLRL